jgi:4-aminobutyrate aminotransferase
MAELSPHLKQATPVLVDRGEGVVRPDVLITAKGLASGFPLSAIAASHMLMERVRPGSQGGTYGGNPVSCAAALATLRVIDEEDLVARAPAMGARLERGLRMVADANKSIGDVRGLGLMLGSEFTAPDGSPDTETAARAQRAAAECGLLLLTCGAHNNVVRMIPAFVVDEAQVDAAVELWARAVEAATN